MFWMLHVDSGPSVFLSPALLTLETRSECFTTKNFEYFIATTTAITTTFVLVMDDILFNHVQFLTLVMVLNGRGCSSYRVPEGGVASLSCQYSVHRFGLSRVCWGRDCGTFWCSNILVQADENGVVSKVSDRYRLTGDVLDGELDLDILDVRRSDSGPYCCRVDVNGIFNDKKTIMNLRVVRAPGTSPPTTTTTTTTTTTIITTTTTTTTEQEEATPTVNWRAVLSSQLEVLKNSTLFRSEPVNVEEPVPSLSVQINVPVLSLSLSVLFILAAVALFLALKRGKWLKSGCFSDEPRHIIYEIRMRRPVQENIYTLD